MSLKAGDFSFQARTAENWLRMAKYGTYLEFNGYHEAPLGTAHLSIHSLSAVLELILGHPLVASSSLQCSCGHFEMHLTYVGLTDPK